jgi:hypothetical protein
VDLGRFTTPDPLTDLAWTDPTLGATNAYGYVQSNPLGFIDPMGALEEDKSRAGSTMTCVQTGFIIRCQYVEKGPSGDGTGGSPGGDWSGGPEYGGSESLWPTGPDVPTTRGGNNAISTNCSVNQAGLGQYMVAGVQVVAMTAEFVSGLGPRELTFGPDSATSQAMAQSAGVRSVLDSYRTSGQTTGLYTFGLSELAAAGGNPVAQFVGSFRWSITPVAGGINLSLTNTSSFKSLTYGEGPQWQRGAFPTPMGNTHQKYNITATCR